MFQRFEHGVKIVGTGPGLDRLVEFGSARHTPGVAGERGIPRQIVATGAWWRYDAQSFLDRGLDMDWGLVLTQILNGLQLGVLLFLVAAGLTLVFGIMDFINLAHGSMYMIGAFVCAALTLWLGSFLLAIIIAIPVVAALGIAIEYVIVRRLYHRDHLDHVLATFGLILCLDTLVHMIFGPTGYSVPLPAVLNGQVQVLPGIVLPAFRPVIIAVGLSMAAGLYYVVGHTRLGMLIRAGASNRTMVGALGVDIRTLFTLVFELGSVLAGIAGMMIAPITEASIGMGNDIIILAFVVIIIGGFGSV
jgi:branched-chain amino acid transport system permease protein